jgi:hypothetical protein
LRLDIGGVVCFITLLDGRCGDMGKANTATFEPWKYFIAKEGKIVAEVHEVDGDAGEPCSAHACETGGDVVGTADQRRRQMNR